MAILSFSMLGSAAPNYYLATGHTGAQTQIDVNHTSKWIMKLNSNFDFAGGLFVMKDGSNSTANISLAIYQGLNANGTQLALLTLTHSLFCSAPVYTGNCGSFGVHQFAFPTPISLTGGMTYYVELTSGAVDAQSQAYFIKNDSFFIADLNGTPITPEPVTFIPPASVPEPQSVALLGIGLTCLAILRRKHPKGRKPGQPDVVQSVRSALPPFTNFA